MLKTGRPAAHRRVRGMGRVCRSSRCRSARLLAASPMISIAITAFLIVVSINAVNFVDGLDGLASGIVAIGGIAFAIYSYVHRHVPSRRTRRWPP
ncbi:MAG: hypothetical protein ACLUUF_06550 [Bifidobacterium pullorum]